MTRLLASVTNADEATVALDGGADIIDLKNPQEGALGALPLKVIRQAVAVVGRRRPVSATIGDLPMQPGLVAGRVVGTAATGVDIVKIGLFGQKGHAECIRAMESLTRGHGIRIVAVMFADQQPGLDLLPLLAETGFHGVMLDTAEKRGGALLDWMTEDIVADFVQAGRRLGLLTGLAGSLRQGDVAVLAPLGADYLGFRGALCSAGDRKSAFELQRLQKIANLLRKYNAGMGEAEGFQSDDNSELLAEVWSSRILPKVS